MDYRPSFNGKRYTPFHYALISKGSKVLYNLIRGAVMDCQDSLHIPDFTLNVDYVKILLNVMNDSPFIFWVHNTISVQIDDTGTTLFFHYNNMAKYKDSYLDLLVEKAREYYDECVIPSSTDYDVALAVHDKLSKTVVYDNDSVSGANRFKDFFSRSHSLIGPLLFNKGVCEGIADAYTYLLGCMGIKSASVWGTLTQNPEYHAWNVVYLDHEWYHVDVTWDLCEDSFISPPHFFFALNDSEIRLSRIYAGYVPCTGFKYNYYRHNNIQFDSCKQVNEYIAKNKTTGYLEFCTTTNIHPEDIRAGRQTKVFSPDGYRFYLSSGSC